MTGNQANFLQALGWAVLNSLWQLALLWILYQAITAIFKTARSSFKSLLASLLLMTGFGWFIYTFIMAFAGGMGTTVSLSAGFINETIYPGLNNWLQKALPVASVIYLLLLLIPILRFIRNYRYVQVIRRYGLTRIDAGWRIFVNKLAGLMNITKPVRIWVSEWVSSPVTIGFLKPVILVPLAAVNHLTPQQMEAVLLHELSHIKRFDYLVNLIINFIQAILYFNPFAKAFVKIVEKEREKSCDEIVLQFQYDSHDYASALLTLEKASADQKILVVSAAGRSHDLLQRIEMIMGIKQRASFSFHRLASLLAGLFCIIAINALLLISRPVKAKGTYHYTIASAPLLKDNNDEGIAEQPLEPILNSPPKTAVSRIKEEVKKPLTEPHIVPVQVHPGIINADYAPPPPPVKLDKLEEKQVKEAVDASRKVLENAEWKEVEKNIADVFNEQEKQSVKSALTDEFNKLDWNKLENKLREAYNKVDWDRVNNQLYNAINQIKVDSLTRVYNEALIKLNQVSRELNLSKQKSIPDTDISLKEIREKQQLVRKVLNNLKIAGAKKIVHFEQTTV